MKYKFIKTLFAISLIPMSGLFIAVSPTSPTPSPEAAYDYYNDFEYTLTSSTYHESDEEHNNPYTSLEFNVTNTGNDYLFDLRLLEFERYGTVLHYVNENTAPIFPLYGKPNWSDRVYLLAPGSTKSFYCTIDNLTPEQIGTSLNIQSLAYNLPADDFTYNGYEFEDCERLDSDYYPYKYKVHFKYLISANTDYNYFIFYTFEYHGEEYSCACYEPTLRIYSIGWIYSNEEINLDDVVIKDVRMLKGLDYSYGWIPPERHSSSFFYIFLYSLPYVLIGITGLFVLAALVSATILVIKKVKHKETDVHFDPPDGSNNKIE